MTTTHLKLNSILHTSTSEFLKLNFKYYIVFFVNLVKNDNFSTNTSYTVIVLENSFKEAL